MAGSGVVICTVLSKLSHWPVTSERIAFKFEVRYRRSNSRALFPVFRLAQEEHDFSACAGPQFNQSLHRRARVEPRSHVSGEWAASLERSRTFQRPVAAKKFRSVAGDRSLLAAEIRKSDAPSEFPAPHTSHEDRSCF